MRRRDLLRGALAAAAGLGCRAAPRSTAATPAERLWRDIGQLLWLRVGAPPPPWLGDAVRAGDVGAALVYRSPFQAAALRDRHRALHELAPPDAPLLVCADQEGGRVRLAAPATEWPPMARLGELAARARRPSGAEAVAEQVGRAMGDELAALGFDVDFAPVLDVLVNPRNRVIGDRALAADPRVVALLGGALARGLAAAGILACGKHFPGHGRTDADSHLALPVVTATRAELDAVDLVPFRGVPGLPLVMTAHVAYEALDPGVPATLSRRVVTELLRGELGFAGVVVSDDLEMQAVAARHDPGEAAVLAVTAGCDALLVGRRTFPSSAAGLLRAGERSSALRERIAEAAARVRALKLRAANRRAPRPGLEVVGSEANRTLARLVATEE